MALTITIPGAVETTTGSTAPAVLTVGVGAPGQGVPTGGTAGQVLTKVDSTDYNTVFATPSADFITSVTAPLAVGSGVLSVDLSAKANLASPTFTGSPSLPTGTIGVTQTAADSTTALATTAFVTTADNLKANLASPTFTGTPTLPTGTIGVTQTAADSTTALATTAFVTTADNLKSNLASPTFTGTPTLPTGSIGVTQSPGNNTTALATTAFVTAAVPAFATVAQTVTGTSATTALSPSLANFAMARGRSQRFDYITSTSVSGNGAVTTGYAGFREMYTGSTGTVGRAGWYAGQNFSVNLTVFSTKDHEFRVDFSKKIWLFGRFGASNASFLGDANTILRITVGGYATATTGALTSVGFGLSKVGGVASFVNLVVHNGTTETSVATTVALTATQISEYAIYSDGAGNVTLFLDGVQAATTSAGPTTASASFAGIYREQVESTASAAVRYLMHCYGGGIILES